eukprot:1802250-Rhodomonas_salina.1
MEVEAEKSSSTTLSVSENDSVLGPLSKIESAAGESLFGNGAVQVGSYAYDPRPFIGTEGVGSVVYAPRSIFFFF